MARVLLTAFEPYGGYDANASWLALMELTREMPAAPDLTTRLYPVDFAETKRKLREDLTAEYDLALHLGQSPGSTHVALESFALNAGASPGSPARRLSEEGADAFACGLPLEKWAADMRDAGVPAQVSHHAGVYLCNAIYYWSHFFVRDLGLTTRSLFVHLPLDTSQVLATSLASLPAAQSAAALRIILADVAQWEPAQRS